MKILKFGGSSVAKPERIKHIISILKPRIANGEKLAVVFSAFGGVTDQLIEMADQASKGKESYIALYHQFTERHFEAAKYLLGEEGYAKVLPILDENYENLRNLLKGILLIRENSKRTMDYVLSFGERNSNFLIAEALKLEGVDAAYLDARKIIKTDKDFGSASVNFAMTNHKVKEYFAERAGQVQVVTGFIASDVGGLTTTLGRGGSDYTAAILAGALNAEVLEIWTDVDGVLTSDPRKVKTAFTLPSLSYAEAMEMSHFGAKVIYPPTIQPALKRGIPIYIKNTFKPDFVGTLIGKESDRNHKAPIKGITSLSKAALIRLQGSGLIGIPGVSSRFFSALGRHQVNIVLISQASSEHSICIAISESDAKKAKKALDEEFSREIEMTMVDPAIAEDGLSIVAVVGESMRNVPGVAGKLFESLGRNGINVIAIAQGSSELNISFVIHSKDEAKALNQIHDSFFLSDNRRINLFVIGVGLIGGTLLQQIRTQRQHLIDKMKLDINVIGISNSRKMLFAEDGINLGSWQSDLDKSELTADPADFVRRMKELNLSNSVFIDNTANKTIPDLYKEILTANISVTTPNKVATSRTYDEYKKLKQIASDRKIHFKYETNVGAGLPVISTIQNLIHSGDEIEKIEAVVSGSLSFIFNNFDSSKKFSELVAEAKKLGYTEPDPREDLSGADVKRKTIILTREAGFAIESDDIVVDQILPKIVMDAPDVDSFFARLKENDDYFTDMALKAEANNEKIRFVATSQGNSAKVSLQTVGESSPFYALESSDNIFVITTKRYHQRPLIIRGPGAGADVTAAGVFADVLMMFS